MVTQTINQESHQPSETSMKLISDEVLSSLQPRLGFPSYKFIPNSITLALSDGDFSRLKGIAEVLAMSSFNASKNPLKSGDFFLIMLKGIAIGLDPMIAIDFISIVDGKPVVDGKGLLALVRFRRDIVEWVKIDSQPTFCTVTIKRKDEEPASSTFTLEHAEKMSLMGKWNWKAQPQTMLKWRAVSQACREICSDIIGGLYTKEEISDADMIVLEDGTMFTPELTPKPEQKPTNITPLPTSAKPSTSGSTPVPTFSNGEKPLAPVEVDPLTITPTSNEPDPNDPEDIRHAIPIYGADHWYVKHYLAFVKLLREVVPKQDTMLNHELSAEGLRLIGKPLWKDFPSGASAITALKTKLGIKDTPTPPTPTPKPASVPTPQPEANANWQNEFAQWLWDFLDIASIEQYEVMSGKKVSDYPTLKDATEDAIQIAQAKQWTICSYRATYVKKGEKSTYIEFQGLFPVRMYGRSTTFKTQVGEGYYIANGVDKWEANQTYKIEGLRIRWQHDPKGTAIASQVEPIQYELDEPPLDLTPEELKALANVDI